MGTGVGAGVGSGVGGTGVGIGVGIGVGGKGVGAGVGGGGMGMNWRLQSLGAGEVQFISVAGQHLPVSGQKDIEIAPEVSAAMHSAYRAISSVVPD